MFVQLRQQLNCGELLTLFHLIVAAPFGIEHLTLTLKEHIRKPMIIPHNHVPQKHGLLLHHINMWPAPGLTFGCFSTCQHFYFYSFSTHFEYFDKLFSWDWSWIHFNLKFSNLASTRCSNGMRWRNPLLSNKLLNWLLALWPTYKSYSWRKQMKPS